MSREEILAKIKGFEEKLKIEKLSDYHVNFREAIETLKGQLGGEEPKEEKPKEEKPKATKKTPPKKKATKKKPTKKQPTKDDYESAMADLKKKSGMTEEKCLEIIEEYRALRKKSQERKAKENKAKVKKNEEQKKRTDKLKEEGKLNEEGTLTPEAVIEQDIPKVEEKAEQEIEKIKEDNTPKPTKEEPKPKPTKQGEKKIKEGVKEVAEDTTDAIQEMLMAILGVVKNQDPSVAKASLIKLRDALTKEINTMAYGGLTDGAVANMNVTQSQMSAESVNPQMYAKGGYTQFEMPDIEHPKLLSADHQIELNQHEIDRIKKVYDNEDVESIKKNEKWGKFYKNRPNEVIAKEFEEAKYYLKETEADNVRLMDIFGGEKEYLKWKRAYDKSRELPFAKGGRMEQGYNDRMDESLGMRHRGHHSQNHKDRRDEAKGMNKGMGNRAYQSVGSMDKMAKGGSTNANWIQDVVDSPNFDKGAFTRKAKNRGMTTMELMKDVLSNPNEYTLKTRRQAQFMKNAM